MILKRWALNFLAIAAGAWTGLWAIQYASQRLQVPPVAGILILLVFTGVFTAVSHAMGLVLFPPTEAEIIRPEIPRQPWAWLRPKAGTLRAGYPINRDQVVLGRDGAADIMLNNDSVSRRHAEIVRLAEGYLLRDLNSKNGTFVNGQRVQEVLLQEGDTVAIGDVQMTFEAPRRTEVVHLEEPEHLSVSQLLAPEVLPLEDDLGGTHIIHDLDGDGPPDVTEGGTQVVRRPDA